MLPNLELLDCTAPSQGCKENDGRKKRTSEGTLASH
jgi:hypothetical protein